MSSRSVSLLKLSRAGIVFYAVNPYFCAYFRQKLTTALLKSVEGENEHLYESYVDELGFESAILESAVRCATDCAMELDPSEKGSVLKGKFCSKKGTHSFF